MAMALPTRKPNRLAREHSPYLQQHAYNPVDWHPWGEEAFEKARREDKPIFLSIGYSTCHWCHVMERESFEDEEIARRLNEYFVNIKLDREERPDIDKVYMTAVQATSGSGGWPMSVWLTPDLQPFFCGTYFPPDARYGRPGFKELIDRIHEVWESNRDGVRAQAAQITAAIRQHAAPRGGEDAALDETPLHLGFEMFAHAYDERHGGFGGAPKFPRPVVLNFLFRYWARTGQARARDMALHTLRAMAEGGLFDQLGGGFHRYSVDERWLVSHFEKMLYDQAQLTASYCEAFQITGDPFFADIARRTCEYVLRDMTAPGGGFYSAEDADSEGVEGKFYVWTREQIEQALDESAAAEIFCRYHGVERDGNWEHGQNILQLTMSVDQAAKLFSRPAAEIARVLETGRARLLAVRDRRPRPHRDEKILTSWNGLMISALCKAAQTLEQPAWVEAAQRAARHLLQHHYHHGRLWRTPAVPAVLDDHAVFANALLDLYETDFDPQWLLTALRLADEMIALFHDAGQGGFFMTSGEDPSVIIRPKEHYDGAEPGGNSVAASLLLRLARFAPERRPAVAAGGDYRAIAQKTLATFAAEMRRAPHAVPQMLCALDMALQPAIQIIIAGQPDAADTRALLRAARQRFLPDAMLMLADGDARQQALAELIPAVAAMKPVDGRAAAHVCRDYICRLPATDPQTMLKLIEEKSP
jgi:uncharacterized protein YyaL (SSP411 family)